MGTRIPPPPIPPPAATIKPHVAKAKAIKVGPYTDENVEQGPQVDDIQFKRVMGYIEKGKAEGAKVATGGVRHGNKGYYVEPTVFTGKLTRDASFWL